MKLQPVVAGSFYPARPKELQGFFKEFEKEEPELLTGEPVGLLLPHAGYMYSGALAALGYRSLPKAPKTVVVAGPSHYMSFRGVSIFPGEAVETPLGDLAVDQEAVQVLMGSNDHIAEIPLAFAREHSVEVHLPLIKTYFPGAKVVPIVMGQGEQEAVEPLTNALLTLAKKEDFLFVASSDLSHYPDQKTAVKADREFLAALLTGNEKKVEGTDKDIMGRGYQEYHCTHCGREPVQVLLRYAKGRGADQVQLLKYRNSGDVTGERDRVVGYAAVAFSK
jgi:AmmeMemoRadiSam system protein B